MYCRSKETWPSNTKARGKATIPTAPKRRLRSSTQQAQSWASSSNGPLNWDDTHRRVGTRGSLNFLACGSFGGGNLLRVRNRTVGAVHLHSCKFVLISWFGALLERLLRSEGAYPAMVLISPKEIFAQS